MTEKQIQELVAERDRYRRALEEIRMHYGNVCEKYETCTHPACHSSYGAWAAADAALNPRTAQSLCAHCGAILDVLEQPAPGNEPGYCNGCLRAAATPLPINKTRMGNTFAQEP